MEHAQVRRVAVWSGAVRLTHWTIAVAALVLLATGAVLAGGVSGRPETLVSIHITVGYILILALAVRVYFLFFGTGADQWRDCVPAGTQWRLAAQTLRYYISWTRTPMPSYFAHNPLWGPVYLAFFTLLTAQSLTGVLIRLSYGAAHFAALSPYPATAPIPALHDLGASLIGGFCVAHVVAAFLHDWKGTGSEVSAMISGYKIFVSPPPPADLAARIRSHVSQRGKN